ncbi:MAG: IS21 family transposase [Candidatus Omnitrophica bacterium]|nr:IS21 family transposase [Candidatus Omnitrophota bacterium]
MKDDALENSVVSLFSKGWSIRRISREFVVSRNRIRRILERNDLFRQKDIDLVMPKNTRPSKLDPYKKDIGQLLENYTNPAPTSQRIFEIICEKGYDGGITTLRNHLATIKPKKKAEPIITVETAPGRRGQHDWSEYHIPFTESGAEEKVIFFSFILSYSRRQHIEVVDDQTQTTMFNSLIHAFDYFGGVPKEIKADNQKACVERWEAGKPIFNSKYLQFATHYRFRPLTIRPGKPRENLKVERPFYFLETNFLNARTFDNRDDLKNKLNEWLTTKNDLRVHRTTKMLPFEMFKEERTELLPLPNNDFDTSTIIYRIVNSQSCVEYQGFFYVVPKQLLFESCPVRIIADELMVYSPNAELLVIHKLADKDSKERYVGRKQRNSSALAALEIKQVITRLHAWHPDMETFIEQIKIQKPKQYYFQLRKLLALKVNYEIHDIVIAVKRALTYKVLDYSAIENFLDVNAEKKNEIKLFNKKD